MNNHPYKGDSPVCLETGCYKRKDDPIHQTIVLTNNNGYKPVSLPTLTAARKEPQEHPFKGTTDVCETCLKHREDTVHPIQQPNLIVAGKLVALYCDGHACPKCGFVWNHDYPCGNKAKESGLCQRCAQETANFINRPKAIEQIAVRENGPLTNREIVEVMNEHEAFVWNMIHDSAGELRSDWQDIIYAHRMDLAKKVEAFRAKDAATSKLLARVNMEELTKLTPEEREQYERDARRNKGKKDPGKISVDKKSQADVAKQEYEKLLKKLVSQVSAKKPNLTNDEVIARAEKMARMVMEEDS